MRSNNPVTGEAIAQEATQSKIVNSIDLNILMHVNIILVPLTVIIYYIFVRFVNNKAMKEQKISIIDSRKGSEHNAEVAESILDGSYLEIDMNDL